MLTPQEVSNRAFSKAVVGGYNMSMVDEFLDELTADYTALYKENTALKSKMKILVDKVEEYRATEDSMRAALMAAQKMANTMVEEAEKRKAELLANAEEDARRKIASLQLDVVREQTRLESAKADTAAFIAQVREVCQRELSALDSLPELSDLPELAGPDAPAEESSVDSGEIEAHILASFRSDAGRPAEKSEGESLGDTTRAPILSDLKFGRNYRSGDED